MSFFTKSYSTFEYFEYSGLDAILREKLIDDFHIHEEDIEDIFSPTQLSKFEHRASYLYFALQFPVLDDTFRIRVQQIHVFVCPKYLFVIDEDGFTSIKDFDRVRNKLVTREHYNSFDLFYELLDISVINMFAILEHIHTRVRQSEWSVFSNNAGEHDQILEIQNIKKAIINFKSVIHPLDELLGDIINKNHIIIDDIGREALDDSLDKIKKIMNRLENFRETMKLITETNEMVTARNTNQNVRRLTLFNVLLLWPSVVAGFFGMNVHFGWLTLSAERGDIVPLGIIILCMLTLTFSMYQFFRYKKWI